ncbi:hypothetical protein NYR60_05570 [Actinobacillus genomosp. 2]|uniref:hypothetical protein n=1 Tax=Actinobacillus genomosp. 2 TaxID=230709 RepID=UPI0024428330|nr:hypothetical protein [Actinobacillus genomosp. 2]WGE31342.1 hypothetical protein NYR60_05570 [Actinobacillus genomosp. 2]
MKLKHLLSAAMLASSSLLSGCGLTSLALYESQLTIPSSEYNVFRDNVTQFGMLKSTKQLVMMGDKYWYVLDQKSSAYIQKLMDTKLSGEFSVDTVDIRLTKEKSQNWDGSTYIYYKATKKSEKQTLKELGFSQGCSQNSTHSTDVVRTSLGLKGQIFAKTEDVAVNGKFKTKIPVEITEFTFGERVDWGGVTAIAAVPFAIIGDIVTLPYQLLFLASDSSDWHK